MILLFGIQRNMLAEFKCLKCGHKWHNKPGPTQCPICNYLYVRWVNYEQWRILNPDPTAN